MSCYDNGERKEMVDKIAFEENDIRRTLARLGVIMEVKQGVVLFRSAISDDSYYIDMLRV